MARINNDNQEEVNNICTKIFNIYHHQFTPYFTIEINEDLVYSVDTLCDDIDEIKEQVENITHNLDDYLEDNGYTKDEVETIYIYYYFADGFEPELVHTIYEKEE